MSPLGTGLIGTGFMDKCHALAIEEAIHTIAASDGRRIEL